jgi:sec-independent protein translocase protein TatB
VFDIGFWEFLGLGVLALFVFGPDKLPKLAADAGRMLRQLRQMARGARDEVTGALGSEFSDLGLSDLNPREFVRRQLLDEGADVEKTIKDVQQAINGDAPAAAPAAKPAVEARDDGDAT